MASERRSLRIVAADFTVTDYFSRLLFPLSISALLLAFPLPDLSFSACTPELLWSETYNSLADGSDSVGDVAVDADGDILVVGSYIRSDLIQYSSWLIRKYGSDGSLLWGTEYDSPSTSIDNDWAEGVALDASGNIVVVGTETRRDLSQSENWRIRKYDSAGDLLWSKDYNNPLNSSDEACGVSIDENGNIVVVGHEYRYDLNQGWNWRVHKYDSDGNLIWSREYNNPDNGYDYAYRVAIDKAGDIVVVGSEARTNQGYNWLIRKYNSAGSLLWSRTYNSGVKSWDEAQSVAVDTSGDILVVGSGPNWMVRKYGPAGNLIWTWQSELPETDDDWANGVAVGADGNIVAVGGDYIESEGMFKWNWLIRGYDTDGNSLWSHTYNSPTDDLDQAIAVAIDGGGNIVVAGDEARPDLDESDNWLIRKYSCIPELVPRLEIRASLYQGTLRVFPNPFIRSEAVRGAVKFEGLALGSQVRIYTVRGLLVWEGTVEEPYLLEWNGRNKEGKPVAPGTYLWVAESESSKQRGTLIVE